MSWQSEDGALQFTDADVATMLEMADYKGGFHPIQKLSIEANKYERTLVFTLATPCERLDVLATWNAARGFGIRSAGYFRTRADWLFFIVCEGVNMCVAESWKSAEVRIAMLDAERGEVAE